MNIPRHHLIADQDGQCLEVQAWIPITVLKRAQDIKGILSFGDRFQLGPTVLSSEGEFFNEFASQIRRLLCEKLFSPQNTGYR